MNMKDESTISIDITNYTYNITQTIKVKDKCSWISLNSNETQMAAAIGNSINLYKLSSQGQWIQDSISLAGHTTTIWMVKFNHNSKLIASCGNDNWIFIWSKKLNGQWSILFKLSGAKNSFLSMCFNHDSTLLATGCQGVQVYNFNTNENQEVEQSIQPFAYCVMDVCFNKDSTILASVGADDSIIIRKLNNQAEWIIIQTLKEHKNKVWNISFNSESNQLISSSADNTIKIWIVIKEQWKLMHTLHQNSAATAVSFNNQSNMIISSSENGSIKIWTNKDNGIWKCTQTIDSHKQRVDKVIINSDSKMIISCSADAIRIYKPK